jgi:hypothetical protein
MEIKMKKIFFVILLTAMNSFVIAQTPHLVYSTLIGGSSEDYGHAITVDDEGNVYIAGQANSSNYPTTIGAYDRTANGGSDILVTKLNKEGSALVYSTYIGGSGFDDTRKVFVDKSGSVYLTGATESSNFPLTNNSLPGTSAGYFLKLSSTGNSLDYSSRWAGGDKILVDSKGYLLILGRTNSPTFPTTENAYNRILAGGDDLFVAKIDITNNTVVFSTLIGGNAKEWAPSMVLDSQDNIIIAGQTNSQNFPLKGNTFASYTEGKSNVFVSKLKADGTQLIFSALVGGTDNDWPWDVSVDLSDNVYVTGVTTSNDFPVSTSSFGKTYKGLQDAFLFKLKSDGSQLVYSTFIGGTEKDGGRGIVVDKYGKAYITGCTRSTNFPVSSNAYDTTFNGAGSDQWAWGDPFFLVMNPEGTEIEYSTYLGGSKDEEAYGIAIDKLGNIYLCGITSSSNFPTTEGAYDRSLSGGCNIYVTKFSFSSIDYFGQTTPGDLPIQFATYPSGSWPILHSCPSFSPSGDEAFWATIPDFNTFTQSIYYRKKENGLWLDPIKVSFSNGKYSDKLPCFSGDGKRLYFTSDRPLTGSGNSVDENIWYIEKNADGWSDPICLDNSVNTSQHEGWITVAANNNLYFCRNNILYLATWQNDHYLPAQVLPIYNSASGVLGAIAPDESYYIVQSEYVKNSSGGWIDDLYILMKTNGVWGAPIKLDSKINSMESKCFAKISPDGKFLFFIGDNNNAYWVSTDFTKTITGIELNHIPELPSTIKLNQNYPNPFNPSTVISYQLPVNNNVRLKIYDALGREVKSLVDSFQSAGEHSIVWNATDNSNNSVSSGIYFYKMESNGMSFLKKMILVR